LYKIGKKKKALLLRWRPDEQDIWSQIHVF